MFWNHLDAIPDYETISEEPIYDKYGRFIGIRKNRSQDFIDHRYRYESDANEPAPKGVEPWWRGGK